MSAFSDRAKRRNVRLSHIAAIAIEITDVCFERNADIDSFTRESRHVRSLSVACNQSAVANVR